MRYTIADLPEHLKQQAISQLKPSKIIEEAKLSENNANTPCEKESALQRECERYLDVLADNYRIVGYFHLRNAKKNRSGLPDILIFLKNNRILYVELKSEKGKLTKEQKKFIKRAEILETDVAVIRDIETFITYIKERVG